MKKPSTHDKHTTRRPPPPKAPVGPDEVVHTVHLVQPDGQIDKIRLRGELPGFGDPNSCIAKTPAQERDAYSQRRSRAGDTPNQHLDNVGTWVKNYAASHALAPESMSAILTRLAAEYDKTSAATKPAAALPEAAPELWSKRDLNLRENAPQFIRRVYGLWLGHGLTRKHIKAHDPELYRALSVWLTRHPDDGIASALPRQSDILDDLIDRLSAEFSLEDLRKLGYAINARLRRDAGGYESS